MIQTIKHFFENTLWEVDTKGYPKWKQAIYRVVRVVSIAAKGFVEDKLQLRASALTYYTLLSIVPIIAMAFGVAKGFGFEETLREQLMQTGEGNEVVWKMIMDFAETTLANTKGGIVAGIGFIMLLWSVMKLLNVIELSFNDIWDVSKGRSIPRKFTDYLSVFLLAPILLLLSSSSTIYARTTFEKLASQFEIVGFFGPVVNFAFGLTPYVLLWLLLTLVYTVMPNKRISIRAAFLGAVLAGTCFEFWQVIYVSTQIGVSRYNAIYGSFAALPLFLIWMQVSWLLVFFGAEVAFAAQHESGYRYDREIKNLSSRTFLKLSVTVMRFIAGRMPKKQGAVSISEISESLKLSGGAVHRILRNLVDAGLVAESVSSEDESAVYLPSVDVHDLRLLDVINALQASGNENLSAANTEDYSVIDGLWSGMFEELSKGTVNPVLIEVGND